MKMKFLFPITVVSVFSLLVFVACKKDEDTPPATNNDITVTGTITPTFDASQLQLDSIYTLSNGVKIKVTTFKFYMSNVTLGGTQMIDYSLFDFAQRGTAWFSKTGEFSVGSNLNYGIGVDGTKNHADPTIVDPSSWLYITNANDMHWSWNQGYIFFAIDGKADTLVDGVTNCDWSFSYHIGDNHFYTPNQSLTVSPVETSSKNYALKLKFDFKAFFENITRPIDLTTEYTTHAGPSEDILTEKVRLNFAESIAAYE